MTLYTTVMQQRGAWFEVNLCVNALIWLLVVEGATSCSGKELISANDMWEVPPYDYCGNQITMKWPGAMRCKGIDSEGNGVNGAREKCLKKVKTTRREMRER